MYVNDEVHMRKALELAQFAQRCNEVPIGAVVVHNDRVIGFGRNRVLASHDPTAHAECEALRDAATTLSNYRIVNTTLYVTVEPCLMCVGAMVHARIERLVFGTEEPKTGAVVSTLQGLSLPHLYHRIIYDSGVLRDECRDLIQSFFRARR